MEANYSILMMVLYELELSQEHPFATSQFYNNTKQYVLT